jgi:hypothetical protein
MKHGFMTMIQKQKFKGKSGDILQKGARITEIYYASLIAKLRVQLKKNGEAN